MSNNTKMLIDATHPEETRVVVQRNGRVEEFDFESAARKLLRGNIYLAKVTRVEPSLQAAFVDYGGNRHGFLAFNEIHPDYYQIPVADRQALLDEEAAAEAELEAAADRRAEQLARRSGGHQRQDDGGDAGSSDDSGGIEDIGGEDDPADAPHIVDVEEDEHIEEVGGDGSGDDVPVTIAVRSVADPDVISEDFVKVSVAAPLSDDIGDDDDDHDEEDDDAHEVDAGADDDEHDADGTDAESDHDSDDAEGSADLTDVGASDGMAVAPSAEGDAPRRDEGRGRRGGRGGGRSSEFSDDAPRLRRRQRSYKIQEVIKRRQVILVQVVKEERGNKGAALTTYLSLAGRYTVLMPNTARGGGISRKITNPQDRKRLKAIAQELEVPEGMGLIIRTAGAARTKQEIKRDFEYLLRLWESVRDLTLQSTAPSLVYEEGDLIKRSIRDLYNKDVEEVVVAGEAGYQEAADFMQMLMPSHAKNVIDYKEPTPLFTRYGVERQLNAMFLPQVTLRSGGYIVINQTEALVAIDVNSGKSTREFSIEETALATNLEAADEIARQLKLRDLAGLIVIDFIDMEEKRNNRSVERRLKDALRFDRARIQLGRISHFGLMEMSRQRLRTGVLEGSTSQCPHCVGTGIIRSTESIALAVLRGLEDTITAGTHAPLVATTTPTVALYILNSKRAYITEMEARHGYQVTIVGSDRVQGANFTIDRGAASLAIARRPERAAVNMNWGFEDDADGAEEAPALDGGGIEMVEDVDDRGDDAPGEARGRQARSGGGESEEDGNRRGRRRRRGRGGRGGRGSERGSDDTRRFESRGDRAEGGRGQSTGQGASAHSNGAQYPGDEPQPFVDTHDARLSGGARDDDDASGADEISSAEAGSTDRAEGPRAADGERNGRRRRRGRRGGRRGRDRDAPNGAEGALDAAESDQGDTSVDGDEGVSDVVQPAAPSGHRNEHRGGNRGEQRQTPREPREPRRQQRIWDAPAASELNIDADMTPLEKVTRTDEAPARIADDIARDAEPEAAMAPTKRRHEMGSSEPRIERVVVRPDQPEPSEGGGDSAVPQRKGWWQRRFGGE